MAQIVRILMPAGPLDLSVGTFADLPTLTKTLLTGSGWLLLTFAAIALDASAAPNACYVRAKCDGQSLQDSLHGGTCPASGRMILGLYYAFRAGAGQHVIALEGEAIAGAASLLANYGGFTIQEPGY